MDPLEQVWARIPDAHCRGLCQDSCGPIGMSETERTRIQARHGILIRDMETRPGTMDCPALGDDGRCRVYENRPTVCRLWASCAAMPCPHGCSPTFGHLDDLAAAEILRGSLALDDPAYDQPERLHRLLADPVVGPLFARAMRGDRSVYPALAAARDII